MNLKDQFLHRYPHLTPSAQIEESHYGFSIKLPFLNKRYIAWIEDDEDGGVIAGINFLHLHFDSGGSDENLNDALQYFNEIINDEVVAIGIADKEENYVIAIMETQKGIARYSHEIPRIEISSFSKNY